MYLCLALGEHVPCSVVSVPWFDLADVFCSIGSEWLRTGKHVRVFEIDPQQETCVNETQVYGWLQVYSHWVYIDKADRYRSGA